MNKLIPLIATTLFFSISAYAELQQTTLTVKQPFNQVNAKIKNNLERCISRPFNIFQNGRRIETKNINSTYIYHVEEYQLSGVDMLDNGTVIVSKEKNGTVVSVTNRVDFIGPNLDLLAAVKRWLSGNNRC